MKWSKIIRILEIVGEFVSLLATFGASKKRKKKNQETQEEEENEE